MRILEVYPRGTTASTEAKRQIAEFCGVSIHAVTDWFFRSNHLPRGEQFIKLMCFLDLNGYKVIEFERMPIKIKNFTKLIGFGLITSQEAAKMLGYSGISPTSTLFVMLRGKQGTSSEVEEKLWDMWKARKDNLDEAVEKAALRFRLNFSRVQNQEVAELSAVMPTDSKSSNFPIDGAVDIMQGLLKLLDSGILQDLSDADCATLRNSSSIVLRLSSHLSTLSAKLVKPN